MIGQVTRSVKQTDVRQRAPAGGSFIKNLDTQYLTPQGLKARNEVLNLEFAQRQLDNSRYIKQASEVAAAYIKTGFSYNKDFALNAQRLAVENLSQLKDTGNKISNLEKGMANSQIQAVIDTATTQINKIIPNASGKLHPELLAVFTNAARNAADGSTEGLIRMAEMTEALTKIGSVLTKAA